MSRDMMKVIMTSLPKRMRKGGGFNMNQDSEKSFYLLAASAARELASN